MNYYDPHKNDRWALHVIYPHKRERVRSATPERLVTTMKKCLVLGLCAWVEDRKES